jgi:hypothetical protein
LDSVIAGCERDFDRVLALADWVADNFPAGQHVRNYSPEYDIELMLADKAAGAGFQCDELSAVFIQAATSVGLVARGVSMQHKPGDGHAFAEVWLDDDRRWVVYDLLFDRYYIDATGPVSALYLKRKHDAGQTSDVDAMVASDSGRVRHRGGFENASRYLNSLLFNMRPNFAEREGVPVLHPDVNHVSGDVLWAGSSPTERIRARQVTDDSAYVYFSAQ